MPAFDWVKSYFVIGKILMHFCPTNRSTCMLAEMQLRGSCARRAINESCGLIAES